MKDYLRFLCVLLLHLVVCSCAQLSMAQSPTPVASETVRLSGYGAQSSKLERDWEIQFQGGLLRDNLRENMRLLSAYPHHVGSQHDKENAQWIFSQFRQWGFDVHMETFEVLFPTPKERVLELVQPTHFRAKLEEPVVAVDPTTKQRSEQLPTYNAYSADGDVTASLVYVNYGNREDYEQLDRLGISVKGAIVIARYGEDWRGTKPKVAAEHGAIGCIIYSDPKQDGFFNGDGYPTGGWRSKDEVQRGSVMDTDYPGDPLTPGVGATRDAKRLSIKDAKTLTRIPVVPISYADALPLLSALQGPVAPESWRGALPITYRVGPGPAQVHLKVISNWDLKPVYNVIATMRGSIVPDQWVIRGNHHDAWVNGATDPLSGMVAMLEEARVMGKLHTQGWSPKRTVIFCAWDGEEPGLLGSTEWVETHLADLREHAVAYINSDGGGRGYLAAVGSHDLEKLINDIARIINDPEKGISVWQRARLLRINQAASPGKREAIRKRSDLRITPPGSGSDYPPFLDYAGISILDLNFEGEDEGVADHSIYDDFYWYTHFSDTDFSYGRALAQIAGTAVMRLADADVIPFEYSACAETIAGYVDDLKILVRNSQAETIERNLELEEGLFSATADPRKTFVPPQHELVPPFLNFAPLENAVNSLTNSANRYQAAFLKWESKGVPELSQRGLDSLNGKLMQVQRMFLLESGLPRRPWFKHQVYAPGAYTGYAAKTLPAIREYLEERKWNEAESQIPAVAKVLENAAGSIGGAADELERMMSQIP